MKRITLFFFLFLFAAKISAQDFSAHGPEEDPRKDRISFSCSGEGVLSFYSVDKRQSAAAVPRVGGGGDFLLHYTFRGGLQLAAGIEIMSQGCAFRTYYFHKGYSVVYDKSYGYTHTLRTSEAYFPIELRYPLTPDVSANQSHLTYLIFGWSPKIFLSAVSVIRDDSTGSEIWRGTTQLLYENHIFSDETGTVAMAGFERERLVGTKGSFITYEVMFRYTFSRFLYAGNVDSNALMIRNSCLSFSLGYRFR